MATFDISKGKAVGSHDSEAPPNLVSFMLKSWKPRPNPVKGPVKKAAAYRRRREALSKKYPGELLIIPTGHLRTRSADTFYPFRAGTNFYYLTGNQEPDCVLALVPKGNQGHESVLFVEENPGKSDKTFFTDRVKGELWEGPRLGVEPSGRLYAVDRCRPLTELISSLKTSAAQAPKGFRLLRGMSPDLDKTFEAVSVQTQKDADLLVHLDEMKLYKDSDEIKAIADAVKATKRGFEDVIQRMKTAKSERELEGVFWTRARMDGNEVGYTSIVASGDHACTLHWKKNDGTLKKRDLLLLDAGVEGKELYTADITRTLPIGGKFSREQRQVYELVLAAQQAAFKKVKPGNDFMEPNRAAMKVLAEGLEKLGILPTTAEEALKEENQFYKRYSLHNVSHMLGLDVHDCAKARAENYKYGTLKAGMVLTIEPGLYFQTDDLTVPPKYRGIGVRIEDDVVVTEKGCKNLSSGIPSKVSEIEKWISGLWKKKKN